MEPPEGAVLSNGWWRYTPSLPPRPEIVLAASGATGDGWSLCSAGSCLDIGATAGEPTLLKPCGD